MEKSNRGLLVFLGSVTLVVFVFFCVTLWQYKFKDTLDIKPPKVMLNLLQDLVSNGVSTEDIADGYFEKEAIIFDKQTLVTGLEYYFRSSPKIISGYNILSSTEHYIKLCLVDSNGDNIYPVILFRYSLSKNNRVNDFLISYLQPLSRMDEEYVKFK